ncbi:MAG: ATP-binding cassette domain-containing protein [Pseudomonadota bacterium]
MAEPPLLTLSDVALGWGGDALFDGLSLAVHQGERIALVGRNGSGKSTLMKVMAGAVEPDAGERFVKPGAAVARLPQDPDLGGFATLAGYVAAGLPEGETWRGEAAMDGLKVPAQADPAQASGGERRRAALARTLAQEADLLLLDEPTNHLDIEAIAWLEAHLAAARAAIVLVSHDRAFLRALTRQILWVDRGKVRRLDRGFASFEDWRDKIFEEEAAQAHKLDRLIKSESVWAVEGISARRKRNMGRVRRLQDMKAEAAARRGPTGTAAMALDAGPASGRRVVEAEDLSHRFGDRLICRDFSLRIMRGDRVAFVGPNGVGKTTLIKILTGEVAPDAGRVTLGTNLIPVVFDQARAALDPERSLWDTLTHDPAMSVSGKSDQVLVRGRPKHVVGYLKEFLFDERQARGPVKALSGGERARLLLARIMARESNLLILDEPTNDLDVETLDLLQELVSDYPGTVLLVSHDRDFLDRTATTTVRAEGAGRWTVYAGGWTDMLAQAAEAAPEPETARAAPRPAPKPDAPPLRRETKKLSFNQSRRLETLPDEMDRLAADIAKLETLLADPELYARDAAKFDKATKALDARQKALAEAEEEWLELEALREELEG